MRRGFKKSAPLPAQLLITGMQPVAVRCRNQPAYNLIAGYFDNVRAPVTSALGSDHDRTLENTGREPASRSKINKSQTCAGNGKRPDAMTSRLLEMKFWMIFNITVSGLRQRASACKLMPFR